MKSANKVVVIAVALLVSAASPAAAQVTQSASPILDLINKGKTALNDFKYRSADSVWQQLLTRPLSRQQRIEVLQLLAATMYPDDAAEQKRDSAAAVIRQLVGMGVRKFVVREVAWQGLDALYASVVAEPGIVAGPPIFDSVRDVVALVSDGHPVPDVVERVSIDCYAFSFDDLELQLRRFRAAAALPDALKQTCTRLHVESDPPNANLTVGQRNYGPVSERGQLRWVQPEKNVEIAVTKGQSKAAKVVEFPQGKLLHARFFLQKDTILWPSVRTPQQIAEELRLYDRFVPSTNRPPAPARPRGMNAFATGMLWGILGGAAGFAAGQFLPAAKCTVNETVPAGETWKVRGKQYTGGQTVNMGEGMKCNAMIAGGAGLGLFTFTATIKGSKNRGATARYNEASRAYPTVLKEWEERERLAFAERNPDVRQRLADQQIKLSQTQSENAAIKARNSNIPEPQITVRELRAGESSGPTTPPTAADLMSDVDMRVPSAAAANPDAVAIVIGNRDYQVSGVPKADFAIRDAKSVQRYLVEAFGFSEDRVILDTNVSVGRMNELFGSVSDASSSRLAELVAGKPGVDVFVFYSGHGGPEGRPAKRYLIPVDANPRRLTVTGYPLDVLYKNLTALRARSVTVAIDAGFGSLSDAGSLVQNQSFGGAIELEVGTVGGANAQVFLSTSANQTAKWRRDQGHGLFTYFFLKGLQGSADANGDQTITAAELETYVKANVRSYAADRMSGAQQVPEVFTNNPSRPLVTLKTGN